MSATLHPAPVPCSPIRTGRTRPPAARWLAGAAVVVAVMAAGCEIGPPRVTPPRAPGGNDPAYTIEGVGLWNLIGNDLTPGHDSFSITVTAPDDVSVVDVWVAGGPGQRLTDAGDHRFTGELAIGHLGPGQYELLLAADGSDRAFARLEFFRTHPMYFFVSTDWDFADPGPIALDYHDQLRAAHPDIRFTQFVGPYTYTDPNLPAARKDELTAWLTSRRDQYDDEIALHIHPWCHFVVSAGLTCITDASTVYADDPSGYTVRVEAYGRTDFETLLTRADQIFTERGLGTPITFRAGGWTASVDTLAALAAKGFVADTSANNWARMEEWQGTGTLYQWNMTNWSSIGDTSQPYYPNQTDKLSAEAPQIPILEVPDNAIMVDYVSTAEMIDIFAANWPGPALTEPRTYMMGFHPSQSMDIYEYRRLDGILDHADAYLASDHAGPVVYEVLRDMPLVWKTP